MCEMQKYVRFANRLSIAGLLKVHLKVKGVLFSTMQMETTDIEDIYDSLKRLYGDEPAPTTPAAAGVSCGMHQGNSGLDMPGFPVRAM